jgi:lipoate-protein ligase A
VSGSSQTRKKGVILQHGSIPLEMDQDILFDICRFRSEAIKERLKRSFHTKASAINQLLEQPSTLDEVKHAFKQGFEKAFGVNLTLDGLTAEEEETARLLVKEKYATEAWNMNK